MATRVTAGRSDALKEMKDLTLRHVDLEQRENRQRHRTEGFRSSKALVLRRGAPFRVSLQLRGRALDPRTDELMIKLLTGNLYVTRPVTFSQRPSTSSWEAYIHPEHLDTRSPSVFIQTPATAPVGSYRLQLYLTTPRCQRGYRAGRFTLLCNPWCQEDAVFLPFEDQREDYVQKDSGVLYTGTPVNLVSRPWSFDQYEPNVMEACLSLLQISPQNRRGHFLCADPVYISRVVSAMINSEDDRGVLKGRWSGDFGQGVHPGCWTGSADILTQWAESAFRPVKYGQCWVFAAVMCTVMRVLGIPCRVVTNFNSAHDTNGNLVIEEFYSITGKKLPHTKDSVWNFHVWVECWMARPDLGTGLDGWQVLDPTPQERSGGVFCCGPAPVKAIRGLRINVPYDLPFIYAEVNAEVHTVVLMEGRVLSSSRDTKRVGKLICTQAVGCTRPRDITAAYKHVPSPDSTLRRRTSVSGDSCSSGGPSNGMSVTLTLDRAPVAGEPIAFTVTVTNTEAVAKVTREHLNAQAKEYDHSPSNTFWESHRLLELAPREVKVLRHHISADQYEGVMGERLVNLAVVLEDSTNQERVLASEEFNIANPELEITMIDEDSVMTDRQQTALVSFTNSFSVALSGVLTVSGAGLVQGKLQYRMRSLWPGERVQQQISFLPKMAGTKMMQASLTLANGNIVRGFKMVSVNKA